MGKLEEIEQAVRELTPEGLAAFRTWFIQYEAAGWDDEIESDVRAGRLDALAEEALADDRAGQTRDL